mgnify:CR=1 FL=1
MNNRVDDPDCGPILENLRERLISRLLESETNLPETGELFA